MPVAHVVLVAAVLSAAASNGTATDATEVALQHACTTSITKHLPFCNVSLNFTERIKDLLGRLTTEEKLSQTSSTQAAVRAMREVSSPPLDIAQDSRVVCVWTSTLDPPTSLTEVLLLPPSSRSSYLSHRGPPTSVTLPKPQRSAGTVAL